MSGPKVINIQAIRRQQQRESKELLRQLRLVIEECIKLRNESSEGSSEFRKIAKDTLQRLDQLRSENKWEVLVAETASYRDFYLSEVEGLRLKSVERRKSTLRREHNLRQGRVQVVAALMSLSSSPERDMMLEKLVKTDGDEAFHRTVVSEALSTFGKLKQAEKSQSEASRLHELAAVFVDKDDTVVIPSMPMASKDPDEIRLERCWHLLAELELSEASSLETLKEKAAAIDIANPEERPLLLDSLALEISSYLRSQREKQAALTALSTALSKMETSTGVEAENWKEKLLAAQKEPFDTPVATSLSEAAEAWICEKYAEQDANEQRSAILSALNSLGYEVREGMDSAWAEEGRIIVHKPSEPFYGVEFSASSAGSAFQTRIVATGQDSRGAQRDKEVEESWCGEFSKLREILAADGFQSTLTKAFAPGKVPMKRVLAPNDTSRSDDAVNKKNRYKQ